MNDEQPTEQNVSVPANTAPSTVSQPINTAPANQPATAEQLTNAETDIESRMSSFERATLRWTRAMFFVTTATALFIGFQWREMHDAGTQTDKIIAADERLAKAMEDSVKKSGDALNASIEASRTDQRAWVGVKDRIINPPSAENDGSVLIEITNTGKAPALNVHISGIARREWGDSLTDIKDAENYPIKDVGVIMPNQPFTIPSVFPHLTELGRQYAREGKIRMVSYGIIRYEDVFKRVHTTTLCLYSNPTFNAVSPCSKYNNAN